MKPNRGFTLIEILVVIAILAGLVAILFPNFMDVRQRARDAQRKSDLKQIQKALEYFKQDQNPPLYPSNSPTYDSLPAPGALWTSGTGNVYMNKMPGDPSGPCSTGNNQYYYYRLDGVGSDGLAYNLYACLENSLDPDAVTCTPDAPFFQSVSHCPCAGNKCYKITNP